MISIFKLINYVFINKLEIKDNDLIYFVFIEFIIYGLLTLVSLTNGNIKKLFSLIIMIIPPFILQKSNIHDGESAPKPEILFQNIGADSNIQKYN